MWSLSPKMKCARYPRPCQENTVEHKRAYMYVISVLCGYAGYRNNKQILSLKICYVRTSKWLINILYVCP